VNFKIGDILIGSGDYANFYVVNDNETTWPIFFPFHSMWLILDIERHEFYEMEKFTLRLLPLTMSNNTPMTVEGDRKDLYSLTKL
jgi:hypothetical protein